MTANPAEVLARVRTDVERQAVRARNGVKYFAGIGRPQVGQTPKDVVWKRDKVELWRYRSDRRRWRPPVFVIYSLICRSYVLDLSPDNTFVGRLLKAGLDVFLIDWGVPDERDADNSFETYVDYYLPQAVMALLAEAGSDGLTLLGYCLGGDLALLLAARHPELPVRNLITVATPVDFAEMGMFSRLFSDGRLDADALIDATGNVPPESMRNAFRVIKPTGDVNSYVMLWQNLWSDELDGGLSGHGPVDQGPRALPRCGVPPAGPDDAGQCHGQRHAAARREAGAPDAISAARSSRCWPSATTYPPRRRWARSSIWSVRRTSSRSGCRPATSA